LKRVTGIGGIFFKATDPDKLRNWYRAHLGIECEKEGGAIFKWRKPDDPNAERCTVWAPFPENTDHFVPSNKPFMINFQVENLDEVLAQLKREGVEVDPEWKITTTANSDGSWIQKETRSNFGNQRRAELAAAASRAFRWIINGR